MKTQKHFVFCYLLVSIIVIFVRPSLASEIQIQPLNPEASCERFLWEKDKENCLQAAKKFDLDWYVAGICHRLSDDDQLLKCWKENNGVVVAPSKINQCAKDQITDEQILNCLSDYRNSKTNRKPSSLKNKDRSSEKSYQQLKVRQK